MCSAADVLVMGEGMNLDGVDPHPSPYGRDVHVSDPSPWCVAWRCLDGPP